MKLSSNEDTCRNSTVPFEAMSLWPRQKTERAYKPT